jgi:hypothetical protein
MQADPSIRIVGTPLTNNIIHTTVPETGVPYMTEIISALILIVIFFGLGWYVGARGITGVHTDIGNAEATIKKDVAKL